MADNAGVTSLPRRVTDRASRSSTPENVDDPEIAQFIYQVN